MPECDNECSNCCSCWLHHSLIKKLRNKSTNSNSTAHRQDINQLPIARLIPSMSAESPKSAQINGGHVNGMKSPTIGTSKNGYFSPQISPASQKITSNGFSLVGKRIISTASSTTARQHKKILLIEDTTAALKRKSMSDLGSGVFQSIEDTDFIKLVEHIRQERLTTLPHKGSRWDTVLIRALHFADRLHGFDTAIQGFASGSTAAANLGFSHCLLLLQLGHENGDALDKAFGLFWKNCLMFKSLLERSDLLGVTSETREDICMIYADLLTLIVEVAIRFYKSVHGMFDQSIGLDMYAAFGDIIEAFRDRLNKVVNAIWDYQIEGEGLDTKEVSIETLNRWLAPQDRVLEMLGTDHTAFMDEQTPSTCVWFQDELLSFLKSDLECLLLNAKAGGGKTTLAASIVERLHRPVSRKTYSTLYCAIGAVPSQATTLNVVKTLLFQLLNGRVGSMKVYHALIRAYEAAVIEPDPKAYEEKLWVALMEILQQPLEHGNETVLVIDGVDEIEGGHQVGQALMKRLTRTIGRAKRAKLIALSETLSLPTGARGRCRMITMEDTRDDLHAVALKILSNVHQFASKSGSEQESLISHLIDRSEGSFLWIFLMCEILKAEKTHDEFNKTYQNTNSYGKITDLVFKLLGMLHPGHETMLLLTWVVTAARPLTYDELAAISTLDPEKGVRTDHHIHIHDTVRAIRPLLVVNNHVVRIRHTVIGATLSAQMDQSKMHNAPIKQPQMDLLLRSLFYAKVTLTDQGEPSLSPDRNFPVKIFSKYLFLEYVVRYWPYHLSRTSIAPSGSQEPKPTSEIKRVFPESTILPILEWLCWDDQFPGSQELELHILAGQLRKATFHEKQPCLLQSYINIASYYETIGNNHEAGRYYYWVATIGRKILSPIHPVIVECSNRFMAITESSVTTKRTEIMTQREQILIILISIYEHQFGVTSELVMHHRELLAELYMLIKEDDHAREILRLLHDTTVKEHGHDSEKAREISNHLHVRLGRGKKEHIDTIGDLFFFHEEEDDVVEGLELDRVSVLLQMAESYACQGKHVEAEQTYVELWQRLSEKCRATMSSEWHEKKIHTVNAYAAYLKIQKREIETAAILTCVAQEYLQHELSYSEKVVTALSTSAQILKNVGHYSMALYIFKQAAAYHKQTSSYQSKEQSSSLIKLEEEIAQTSSIVLRNATSSSTLTERTNQVSELSFESIFQSLINDSSKSFNQEMMTLSKQLISQYMQQMRWKEAVIVIESTLRRNWSNFFASSLHSVSLTTLFLQESIELVEHLAECYLQQRLFEKAEDIYLRLFRASLTSPQHKDILHKTFALIVNFYDKNGFPDRAINVHQDLLAVYQRVLGPTQESTIKVLYELGMRCRKHARPYWVEYYQQITAVLNKDSKICHDNAFEAAIIVATSYYEERRYADAISTFSLLWNTFVSKQTKHKEFSDQSFVTNLYERYYRSLEQTSADWETQYRVTKEYRQTCLSIFGASASITIQATLDLARVTQMNEKLTEEAISYYEEASRSQSSRKSSSSTEVSELRQTLTTLYKRRITTQSSASSEILSKASSVYSEELKEQIARYGYAHYSTLSTLREYALLQCRQQKTEFASRELHTAVTEIITKTTSEEKLMKCAQSIAETFQACELRTQCEEIISELHLQLVAKEKSKSSKFDLTNTSVASLVFLASLEYYIQIATHLTLSEIMADIVAEHIYYENFRRVMHAKSGLDKIVIAAAPLRYFLLRRSHNALAESVERQVVQIFEKRDTADLKLMSKESPHIFIVAILEHLGSRKTADFVRAVILASNRTLAKLIQGKRFAEAYDVANIAFIYAQYHKGYYGTKAISRGFELASYLDGRGCTDSGLRQKMLALSNSIVKEILNICHEQKINMAQVQLPELNQLILLIGEQQDYETLEKLLGQLWNTREAQSSWPSPVLLRLGQDLISARYLSGHSIKAIRLAEDIAYNLRRVHGARHPATLEMYGLLAALYTGVGQQYQRTADKDKTAAVLASDYFKKAVIVHEEVLRWLVASKAEDTSTEEDDSDDDTAAQILKSHGVNIDVDGDGRADELDVDKGEMAKKHLRLLKLSYQRLGAWPKDHRVYEKLNADVFRVFGDYLRGVEGIEKWQVKGYGGGKAESIEGVFETVSDWGILPSYLRQDGEHGRNNGH